MDRLRRPSPRTPRTTPPLSPPFSLSPAPSLAHTLACSLCLSVSHPHSLTPSPPLPPSPSFSLTLTLSHPRSLTLSLSGVHGLALAVRGGSFRDGQPHRGPGWSQFHMQTIKIYKLGFHQNYFDIADTDCSVYGISLNQVDILSLFRHRIPHHMVGYDLSIESQLASRNSV